MTNEMLFDIIDILRKRAKILLSLCIVLTIVCTIFVVLFSVKLGTTEMNKDTTQISYESNCNNDDECNDLWQYNESL